MKTYSVLAVMIMAIMTLSVSSQCVPEGQSCADSGSFCCGMNNELKCSKDTQTCFECTAIDAECSTDEECCYSCCEKGLGKSTGKCTDGDMCHMGRIILWIIVVRLVEIGVVIGVICLIIYWICKHCFGVG